jgi:hypothetical protein
LGIAAQGLLVIVIIGYIMPLLGLELLDMARDVAAFNLPARSGGRSSSGSASSERLCLPIGEGSPGACHCLGRSNRTPNPPSTRMCFAA